MSSSGQATNSGDAPPSPGDGGMHQAVSSSLVRRGQHNLPVDLTRFLGRGPEIAEVKRLLLSTRLLTLAGSAGVGKTRLALHVGTHVVDQYRDGVWLVELAAVADPLVVPQSVAQALGISEQPGRSVQASLVDVLRPTNLLLVLDNCEHLVQACAELAETLLRACPDLRILATSRQSLHAAGETTWRVPSMALPVADRRLAGATLVRYDATRLFVERAKAALPSFVVSDQTAATIARICAQLDGIPLAIELAAARVSVLGVDQIDKRLRDRLRLLTDGSRTALPRQQTLRATLDWSHSLLSAQERVLFHRLAVFAGSFTLEAAEAICVGASREQATRTPSLPTVTPEEILDLLAGLVDKSLVIARESGGLDRYRLLEMVRQYGSEKLRLTDEEALLRDRHRDWFLALAEEADRKMRGPEQADWLTDLEREHDNLRAALAWCLGEGRDCEAAVRLAGALAWFWRLRGHLSEGRRWLDLALAAPGTRLVASRPRALNGVALLAVGQGDYRSATAWLEESLALARGLADDEGMAWALHALGRVAYGQSDYVRGTAVLEESLAHFQKAKDIGGSAYSLYHLANFVRDHGDDARATMLYEEGLARARDVQDTWGTASVLYHWGNLRAAHGHHAQAAALYRESLTLFGRLEATWGIVLCLWGLTGVAGVQGRSKQAARLYGAEQSLHRALGLVRRHDPSAYDRGVAAARAVLGTVEFERAAAAGQAMTLEEVVAYALVDDAAGVDLGTDRRVSSSTSPPLTPREREVAALIARGFSNRAIAIALVITPRTVDTHVMNVFTKLGLHSRAQVAAWAVTHDLLAKDT